MRLCLFVIAFSLSAFSQNTFQPNGNPFGNFGAATDFDSKCSSVTGTSASTGSKAQDKVKNNLAAPAPAKDITILDLAGLQTQLKTHQGFPWGQKKEPNTRQTFHQMNGNLQEGRMVRLTAYVFKAKNSDTTTGESVTCNMGTEPKSATVVSMQDADAFNDIHIALVQDKAETNECKSVTAEIIPHFRPAVWKKTTFSKGKLVRLTGQLMYDASHIPCTAVTVEDPKRQAGWEVHPVYQVEVCSKDDAQGNCTGQWKKIS